MEPQYVIDRLERNIRVFQGLLSGINETEYRWKQEESKWNLLEIVCHLFDEEREDFRARLKYIVEHSEETLAPIDPQGWVKERSYSSRDFGEMLEKFLEERKQSVEWLRSLDVADYKQSYQHPKLGTVDGNWLLANWLAHDYLHFRQITRLQFDYLKHVSEQSLDYAGTW